MNTTSAPNPQPLVYCYGEALWDIFPNGAKPGGAPMNVAYHLSRQGIPAGIISSLGNDDKGKDLLTLLNTWKISTALCQIDQEHPTGSVIATIDQNNEPSYNISEQAAWDYITINERAKTLTEDCQAFIYGSLATRNNVSRSTLLHLLRTAPYKVFDINIRPPFYSIALLSELMLAADLLKLNESELRLLMHLKEQPFISEDQNIMLLREQYNINEVLLTKGSAGAKYYNGDYCYEVPAVPVAAKDTVGSGDAFLAGFLAKRISNVSPGDALINAAALGAFVAAQESACPAYGKDEFEQFHKHSQALLSQRLIERKLH